MKQGVSDWLVKACGRRRGKSEEEPAQGRSHGAQPVLYFLASPWLWRSQELISPPICFPIHCPFPPGPLVSCSA